MNRESAGPYLSMLCGSLAFALMGILANALGESCDWQVIALARTSLVLVFALALALCAGVPLVVFRPATLWMRSVAGSVSLVCTFYALTQLPVSEVLTLTNMFPVWVVLLSWPLLGERPAGGVWLLVGCAALGVVLVQQPHFAAGSYVPLLALLSSLSTALAMLGLHRLKGIDTRAIVVHFSAVAVLFVVVSFFLFDHATPLGAVGDGRTLLLLLGVGVTATFGQLFLTRAFAAGPPAKISVVGLTQIVFAMGLEAVLTGQTYQPMTLLGMALVVAPTAWLMAYRPPEAAGHSLGELSKVCEGE